MLVAETKPLCQRELAELTNFSRSRLLFGQGLGTGVGFHGCGEGFCFLNVQRFCEGSRRLEGGVAITVVKGDEKNQVL